jgi:hypothetical protein
MTATLVEGRTCRRCGTTYPPQDIEQAFQTARNSWRVDASLRRHICVPCEDKRDDARKANDRWIVKARDTLRRHGERLQGVTKHDLVHIHGWSVRQIAHDAEHRYGNGCDYCHKPYADMDHGYSDITLDIRDRRQPPDYGINTAWCCQTCNRRKGILSPEQWARLLHVYTLWVQSQNNPPEERGMLF